MLWRVVPEPDCAGEERVFMTIYIGVGDWEVEILTLVSGLGGLDFLN